MSVYQVPRKLCNAKNSKLIVGRVFFLTTYIFPVKTNKMYGKATNKYGKVGKSCSKVELFSSSLYDCLVIHKEQVCWHKSIQIPEDLPHCHLSCAVFKKNKHSLCLQMAHQHGATTPT